MKEENKQNDQLAIPDYFAGRLIYFDDMSAETMRWVVYDGRQKTRFTSRAAAERWCAAESMKLHSEVLDKLMIALLYLDKAKCALDSAATFTSELREEIEFYALGCRRIEDKIDTIIAQHSHKNDEQQQ